MSVAPYFIPNAPARALQEIKRSRFVTQLAHTPGITRAKAFIQQIKDEHPGARHHCWGFVAGAPGDPMQLGFSDDKEPSGTAGKPILAQLMGSGLGEVCAVVSRYSGGIKLGTGGLVRAYAGGVKLALEQMPTTIQIAKMTLHLSCAYTQQNVVDRLIKQFSVEIIHADFSTGVNLHLQLNAADYQHFSGSVKQQSRGQISLVATNPDI